MKTFQQFLSEQTEHPMIDVDGVQKHRHNSEGKPIHHTDEGIKNFHRWFAASKTVDKHGRPQVHYHGTHSDIKSFSTNADLGHTIFASPDHNEANLFAYAKGANVHKIYVKSENPHPKTVLAHDEKKHADKARKLGHDSIKVKDDFHSANNIAVFHPHQIKSATGNTGKFSSKSDDITESMDN
jgi:hypothetical protein